MLMLLVATAMAVLLAGCGSNLREDQGSSKGSEQEGGSSQQDSVSVGPADTTSVGSCADKGSTVGQLQEAGRGDVSNGKIVFTRSNDVTSDIYVVDEEGAHETRLTCTKQSEQDPVWSPDGQKIVFVEAPSGDLYVINADGTNESRLTTLFSGYSEPTTGLYSPAWSPDGGKIAFARGAALDTSTADSSASASEPAEGLTGIYLINVDGMGLRKLTSFAEGAEGGGPVWSPDGEKIAFYDYGAINVINADGSGRKELTASTHDPPQLAWSPDGQRIAFIGSASELSVINADGNGRRSLTNTGLVEASPTWSPDGEKIAFISDRDGDKHTPRALYVINADGSDRTRLATDVGETVSWGSG
jgi:TolB protein